MALVVFEIYGLSSSFKGIYLYLQQCARWVVNEIAFHCVYCRDRKKNGFRPKRQFRHINSLAKAVHVSLILKHIVQLAQLTFELLLSSISLYNSSLFSLVSVSPKLCYSLTGEI
jgi:hypothetical protein